MVAEHREFIEKMLNLIVKMAGYLQVAGILIATLIFYFKHPSYREIGQSFLILELLASFIISRAYIYIGKKLKEFKTFVLDEMEARHDKCFFRFFALYIFGWSVQKFFLKLRTWYYC